MDLLSGHWWCSWGVRAAKWGSGAAPGVLQESADNCGPEVGLQGKDGLLEEACKKYQAATDLCSTLHEVRRTQHAHLSQSASPKLFCLLHGSQTRWRASAQAAGLLLSLG